VHSHRSATEQLQIFYPGAYVQAITKKNPEIFLPASYEEMRERGWEDVDIILVTGDAYIDHPSFGVALIGRLLESHGYRVAILSQPHHGASESFKVFGAPRLFWGIASGNLGAIV